MEFVAFLLIMAVIFLGLRVYHVNRLTPVWREVAGELGLPRQATGSLTGKLGINGSLGDGVDISISEISGENPAVVFEARYPRPCGLDLSVRADPGRERRDSTLRRLLGRSAMRLDDDHIDATLWVDGDDPDRVAAYLTPTRQHAVASLLHRLPRAVVLDDKIRMSLSGRADKLDDMAGKIRAMHEVALVMTRATDVLDSALDRIEEGDLAEGLADLRGVDPPLRPAALRMAAEIMVSGAGSPAEVAEVLHEMELEAIEDHEVAWLREWVQEAASKQPADHHDARVIGDPRVADAPPPDPDDRVAGTRVPVEPADLGRQEAVLAGLFAGDATTGRERFERELAGTRVTWQGVVRRSRAYGNDLDLGAGPGLKVVVRIGEVDLGDYGDGEVDAVVALPPDAEVVDGAEVTFTATPIRLDGFTRNIFCVGGELA